MYEAWKKRRSINKKHGEALEEDFSWRSRQKAELLCAIKDEAMLSKACPYNGMHLCRKDCVNYVASKIHLRVKGGVIISTVAPARCNLWFHCEA